MGSVLIGGHRLPGMFSGLIFVFILQIQLSESQYYALFVALFLL